MGILTETALSLTAVTKEPLLTIEGRRIHISTAWRWCRKGLRGVRLEYVRLGGRVFTSREALGRFFTRLAEADGNASPLERQAAQSQPHPVKGRTAKQRAADIERARRELSEAGI